MMADVLLRPGVYDDAQEIDTEFATLGVGVHALDLTFGGDPTGDLDPLPIRIWIVGEGDRVGENADAWLTLQEARRHFLAVGAAIERAEAAQRAHVGGC